MPHEYHTSARFPNGFAFHAARGVLHSVHCGRSILRHETHVRPATEGSPISGEPFVHVERRAPSGREEHHTPLATDRPNWRPPIVLCVLAAVERNGRAAVALRLDPHVRELSEFVDARSLRDAYAVGVTLALEALRRPSKFDVYVRDREVAAALLHPETCAVAPAVAEAFVRAVDQHTLTTIDVEWLFTFNPGSARRWP